MKVQLHENGDPIKVVASIHKIDVGPYAGALDYALSLIHKQDRVTLFFDGKFDMDQFAAHVTQAVQRLGEDE